jgi:hypothetical protein
LTTTTVPELPVVPDGKPPRRRRGLLIGGAVALAAGGALAALLAVNSGPATASQIVSGDGYSVLQTWTQATLPSSLVPYATSAAGGINGSGNEELVVVLKPADAALGTLVAGVVQADAPGVTATMRGDDLIVTGPSSAFSAVGGF